jgi:hypothetical protein
VFHRCLLFDCVRKGQCCEDGCPIPQPPPLTECENCDQTSLASFVRCYNECDPEDDLCPEVCESELLFDRLMCHFDDGPCCQETCQEPPGTFLGQYKTKATRNQAMHGMANYARPAGANQTCRAKNAYARAGPPVMSAAAVQYRRPITSFGANARRNATNPLYARQTQNIRPGLARY